MSKFVNRVDYLGMAGIVQSSTRGGWDFIYKTSTVKDEKWNLGDRVVLPDGREFRYAKSTEAIVSGLGCNFTAAGYISYTVFGVTAAVGDTSLTVPAATHATLTQDELAGGYIVIYDNSTSAIQFRQIVGNDAASSNAAFVAYLDGALTQAVTTADYCEVYQNPYAAIETANGGLANTAKAGVAATYVGAASTYFWVQVRGLTWVAPQGGKLGAINEGNKGLGGGFWSDYGNISDAETSLGVTVANARGSQYAGYVVEGDADNNGPLFMLCG
jgi:hypothetical protein